MKVQGEHVSDQSTKHGNIPAAQDRIQRTSTKNKLEEELRGLQRHPPIGQNSEKSGETPKKNKQDFSSTSGLQQVLEMRV
ncbi:hypothetical protein Taro_001304 [Colocasia esculenta]|uniref:Uncharacterized protein n=1 Tax=Colocasia esculenta TaxID=4460 RepID=A0A843TFQ9_COLES|nr:hypothetical protein [Colocasia esculenta]